jgi:multidrug efflux pump subunit AcrA (membrane-fusion protein)
VKVLLDNRDGKLVPGMFARLAIALGAARSLPAVPESALVAEEGGKHSVYVLRGGALFKVPVTPGNRSAAR